MTGRLAQANGAALWQAVEYGSYAADFPLYDELTEAANGPILELGCGIGRVTLRLAEHGHDVSGLDSDESVITVLRARAMFRDLALSTAVADVRRFALGREFPLILAPTHLVQTLGGATERTAMLRRVAAHLSPGGRAAVAVIDDDIVFGEAGEMAPDVLESDGWRYSSHPMAIRLVADQIVIDRIHESISPTGEVTAEPYQVRLDVVTPDRLEDESVLAGLRPVGREKLPGTEAHAGSTVVILEPADA